MLSEHEASSLHFVGLGASGGNPEDAARELASSLRQWTAAHTGSRIVQLSIMPSSTGQSHGAMAVVVYVESELSEVDTAEVVAAVVEEIHESQVRASEPGSVAD